MLKALDLGSKFAEGVGVRWNGSRGQIKAVGVVIALMKFGKIETRKCAGLSDRFIGRTMQLRW